MKIIALSITILLLSLSWGISPASADKVSKSSTLATATTTITQIAVFEPSHANFKYFHGAIWLEYDKQKYNYRWGGTHCRGKGLKDMNVSLLFAAFRSRYSVTVEYKLEKHGKHQFRCINGFTVSRN